MHDLFNPMQNQDPLDSQGLPDDPLLDALERSIENPPGFVDPLAENDESLMDDIAKQLDIVEAGTESTPPILPLPDIVDDVNGPDVQDDESGNPEALESVDNLEGDDDEKHKLTSLLLSDLHDSLTGTTGPNQWPSKPPPGQEGDNRGRREFPIKRYSSRGGRVQGPQQIAPAVVVRKVMNSLMSKNANPVKNTAIGPKAQTKNPKSAGTIGR